YTPENGEIFVHWEVEEDGRPVFAVRDTGVGISAVHLPRLTERFYRVDRGRSRASGGTGLGLAITKQVAVRHDASLDIASEAERGSTFRIVFAAERRCEPAPAKPGTARALATDPAPRASKNRSARAEPAIETTAIDGDAVSVAKPDGR